MPFSLTANGIAVTTINALGFIEVYGLVAGIEAADAMLKSAQVRVLREHGVHPGQISLVVEGDLAACRAAVSAGIAAASRVGTVISSNVIGRPDDDTGRMILDMLADDSDRPASGGTDSSANGSAPAPAGVESPAAPPTGPVVDTGSGSSGPSGSSSGASEPPASQAEKPKPARTATKARTVPERGTMEDVLNAIAASKKGYSWKEIKARFPGLTQQTRKRLDAAVASGELRKSGARYTAPDAKE